MKARPWWLIAAAFCVSRIYAYAAGLRFEGMEWQRFWHFIDPQLLKSSLGESVYHLHSQPPLPNLFMGVSLKVFGSALPSVMGLYFLCLGIFLSLAVYKLMRALGVAQWPAAVLTSLWCASPAMLLFENFLFYTYPVLAMLVAAVWALHLTIARDCRKALYAYYALLTCIVLTRSLFHPLWLLCALSLPIVFSPKDKLRARRWLLAMLSVSLVACVMLKNKIEFGSASLSSWRGMNIARAVLDRLPKETRQKWVAEGKLSSWALVGSFKPLERYPNLTIAPDNDITILTQRKKSNGTINFHHMAYLQISEQLERDARWVIEEHPEMYMQAFGQGLLESMQPATSYRALKKQRAHLSGWEKLYNLSLSWQLGKRQVGPWLFSFPLLVLFGFVCIYRAKCRAERATWVFLLGTILWVILIGALAERTENARFRFLVDPFFLLLAGRLLTAFLTRAKRSKPDSDCGQGRKQTH